MVDKNNWADIANYGVGNDELTTYQLMELKTFLKLNTKSKVVRFCVDYTFKHKLGAK